MVDININLNGAEGPNVTCREAWQKNSRSLAKMLNSFFVCLISPIIL